MNEVKKLNKQMKAQVVRLFVGVLKANADEQQLVEAFQVAVREFRQQEGNLEAKADFTTILENRKLMSEMQQFLTAHDANDQAAKAAALNRMIKSVEDWAGFPLMQKLIHNTEGADE